jgi:imidazolonepropionase-like amidohydrolase
MPPESPRLIMILISARTVVLAAAVALPLMVPPSVHAQAQDQPQGAWAFTNVNVIPMDSERVLRDQTVVVQDGRITAVGASALVAVPAGATRIDGRNRYLLPGLAEMHGHLPGANAAMAEDILFLYVAAGATTVRGMQGHPAQLELKRRVDAGEMIGPRMWLAAPSLGGAGLRPDSAVQRVRAAHAAGYDLLKIHEGLTTETYAAIVRAATELGLPWGGHVPFDVGVPGALAARQSTIDHLDDYVEAMQPPGSPALRAEGAERARLLPLHADESMMVQLARQTRAAGVAVVPTQILWEVLLGARESSEMIDRPENRYMPRATIEGWTTWTDNRRQQTDAASAAREVEIRNRLLRTMQDEGVTILMGTDAPQIFSVPGFALYRELPVMVAAGLSPYEVLRTGTVNVAEFLGISDGAGLVAPGMRADLILLDANPLDDITALEQNAGVMVAGRWLSGEEIRRRLEEIAARHAGG